MEEQGGEGGAEAREAREEREAREAREAGMSSADWLEEEGRAWGGGAAPWGQALAAWPRLGAEADPVEEPE